MKRLTNNEAIELLAKGEIVAVPTETVYGLAADARKCRAVKKIYKAKERPMDNPLIVHIGEISQVEQLTTYISEDAKKLMEHFWPGPLTIVLPSSKKVSKWVTAGLDTIAIRMPSHDRTLEILRKSRIPLAAPSANLSGKPSPTCVEHVACDLGDKIAGIVNGGVCDIGMESTVIDMSLATPVILRPGSISKAEIEKLIGAVETSDNSAIKPKAPGMKYAHYAPNAKIYNVRGSLKFFKSQIVDFKEQGFKVGVLSHKSSRYFYKKADVILSISAGGKQLYKALRIFDEKEVDVILSEEFEDEAVVNRLLKASEERFLSEVEN